MRFPRSRTPLLVAFLLAAAVPRAALASPEKTSDAAIAEGVRLHDAGEYARAIAKYREALARDPENVRALYEMAMSFEAMKDYASALQAAEAGLRFPDPLRPSFHMIIGNVRDEQGDPEGAIAAYRAGIRENPEVPLLHFNLGVACLRQRKWKEGRLELERTLVLRPAHASAHRYLALAYEKEGFKVPAVLALTRFLLLDPGPDRAKEALRAMDGVFGIGYARDSVTGNVSLTVDPDGSREEGDFQSAELGMLMAQAAGAIEAEPTPGETPLPFPVQRLSDSIIAVVEMADAEPCGFAAEYYVPYFAALHASGLLEVAAHLANRAGGERAVKDWLDAHGADVDAFRERTVSFAWPKPAVHP